MTKKYRAGLVLMAGVLFAPAALAQQKRFGTARTFAVSAERLFGLSHVSTKIEADGGASTTSSWTTFSLLGNFSNTTSANTPTMTFSSERIAADYFVIDGLSLGGGIGFFATSTSQAIEVGNTTQDEDGPSLHAFLFTPRGGYAFMFTDVLGLWPRGGLTFLSASGSNANDTIDTSVTATAFTLEVPLIITPVPHVAFSIGPTLDIGLGGSLKNEVDSPVQVDTELDLTQTDIGVHAGMIAYF